MTPNIPTRLFWKDKGEVLKQSQVIELGTRIALLDVYAIIPDDLWDWMEDEMIKVSRRALEVYP